ncbi:MAG: glycoside hydrolase family 5 protein [Melioribacteraceae bacterium]|nr:glycoside hydrolase family 5 protein [Melioribacteraceae bacterium]MCF8353662.1 glycoside hydrolase family 5 protein [Melioribacteraceae bacterium]MCF8393432.1 glycoside hydrolase family 5 protein [Melioribacteraceae bacterium]MCF8419289.1 glycoside hydrolase family 5 protein [Melioribacteraceae bacterium]
MKNINSILRTLCYTSLILLIISACSKDDSNPVEPEPSPPNPSEVDAFEQNKLLGRGINLGNALEAPNEGDWGVVLQESYFADIADAGFNSIRVPIKWSAHTLEDPPYTIDETFFARVDWAIEQTTSRGLSVIVDFHHYDEIMFYPYDHKDRFLEIWRQVAERYKNKPKEVFFEILNEPHDELTPAVWNEFLTEAINIIRETNPNRTLIVGLANWGGLGSLNQLRIPDGEDNVIVSFHYYNPFQFTHQGAEWVDGSDSWLGTKWNNSEGEKEAVRNDINGIISWGSAKNIPINLGEFGAYQKADTQSRFDWMKYVREYAESYNISWHYWEFCAGFGIYNSSTGEYNDLLQALIPGRIL